METTSGYILPDGTWTDKQVSRPDPGVPRYYYRCRDCLGITAADAPDGRPLTRFGAEVRCGACGGRVECMGRVERSRLVSTVSDSPCDGRCTGANGPNCDCRCRGKNHGSQMVVE